MRPQTRAFHQSEHTAVLNRDLAATALHERLGSKRHILVVIAHNKQVVGVVRNGLGQCAMDAKARAEAKRMSPLGAMMAIEHSHLERHQSRGSPAAFRPQREPRSPYPR